ncbi:uncharacterized protein CC84DRAFT_1091515 [Paraphaeosphaeria sporulosa]|uniref:Uncharacterized protein n=1 Tax=Paraphaeosphaeria sporulosa TaxID=1460663 RepID=A0A177CGW8_9PLEO|nr:uncharacterized protein CC84DRAFT_1091515 [Paraphaeosphaeria sporulosa]OAG06192.1 hypothetical protein CC84DRAFT_1091515 [Paraphaeosphaeria sporulosa]
MSTSTFDLQAEWRETCREFISATEIDLSVKSPTAEQITAKLDELDEAKEAKSRSKVGKAKRAVGNTLRAVQTIGSLLAQGAELTGFGGPANVTMNCVSFFIDAGFAYKKIADNIDDLFSRIGPIMERAEVYIKDREVIGPEMELTTHRMLIAVVKTCQHCISLLRPPHSKRSKTKMFFEAALFQSDSGVQSQIDLLITLQEQEMKMASAVTVTAVKKTAVDVGVVRADVTNVATGVGLISEKLSKDDVATAEERIKEEFKAKLGVEESVVKSLQLQYRTRREKLRTGTCAWLKGHSQYAQWSDPRKKSVPVLILSGGEGSGKSYAMTSVIQDLERRYPQGRDDSTRISVAYFYCNRNTQRDPERDQKSHDSQRETRSAKAAPSVKEMLRTWACQIMENDTFYRKDVHRVLSNNADFAQLEDFVRELFLDQLPKGAVFFLLLDGAHEMDEDGYSELSTMLNYLSETSRSLSSLRIMMTAKPSLQRELESYALSSTVTIQIEGQNMTDIHSYVENKANVLTCFKARTNEIQELKSWVISELPAAVNGNFLLAERKLQEINQCQDAESVRQIIDELKRNGASLFDSIDKEVMACNKVLSTKQVRHLNALLLWVIYAAWKLKVYELESILYVQEQYKPFQPLAKVIRENYSPFFELSGLDDDDYATVSIKSSAHAEYFKDASNQRTSSNWSSNQTLSKGEIQIVRHFVEKLCEQDLYDKLGLAEFFDQKLAKSDMSIAVDSLAGGMGEEANTVRVYAWLNLTYHLKQIDLDTVDPTIKAEMGPLLVKMFTDEEVIRLDKFDESSWVYNDEGLSEIVRLLKSSAVIKNVVREQGGEAWINRVLRAKDPTLELLRSQAPIMAKFWLTAELSFHAYKAFTWWYGYCNKVESIDDPTRRIQYSPSQMTSSAEIMKIYEKDIAPLIVGMDSADLKSTRSLGLTFLEYRLVAEAIDALNRVVTADPDDLLARDSLADAYAMCNEAQSVLPNLDEALRHKDLVIAQLAGGKKLYADEDPEESRKRLVLAKISWLRELKRHDESEELLRNALKEDPSDDPSRLELMSLLCESQKSAEAFELLQALESEIDDATNNTAVSRFLQNHALSDEWRSVLVSLLDSETRFEAVKTYYRLAIKDGAADNNPSARWFHWSLVEGLASILIKYGTGPADREEAIALLEKSVRDHSDVLSHRVQCVRRLCKIYVAQAREAAPGSPTADAMITKIKAFSPEWKEETGQFDVSQAEIRALLARYYRSVGDSEKAQETLRPDMELALKLLSDDDPDNDWQGYRKLGDALMDCGAIEEAQAAWSLIQPEQEDSHLRERSPSLGGSTTTETFPRAQGPSLDDVQDDPSFETYSDANASPSAREDGSFSSDFARLKRDNTSMKPEGPLWYLCSGRGCEALWTYADDFYVCCECVYVQFCPACLKKLQEKQLEHEECDAMHEFLHVPAWTPESADRTRNKKVLVGGEEKEIESWLKEIEQAWHLEVLDAKPVAA